MLRSYQLQAVDILLRSSQVLADDVGLGKTATAITAVKRSECRSATIVAPLTLVPQWMSQLDMWWPGHPFKQFEEGPFMVTSYERLNPNKKAEVLVVDEAHYLKDRKAQRTKRVRGVARRARRIWLLSATPTMNNAGEFWSLLNIVAPRYFTSYWRYVGEWCNTAPNFYTTSGIKVLPGVKPNRIAEYSEMLSPWVTRRTKNGVALQLPQLSVDVEWLEPTEVQRKLLRSISRDMLVEISNGAVLTMQNVLSRTIRLRQAAVSPKLLGDQDSGAKFHRFMDLARGMPMLVFSEWSSPLHLLNQLVPGTVVEGSMSSKARDVALTRWKGEPKGPLYLTTGVGGIGLNLTEASYGVFVSETYNPAWTHQAIGRMHRSGQRSPVTVKLLRINCPIERALSRIIDDKRDMIVQINKALEEQANV